MKKNGQCADIAGAVAIYVSGGGQGSPPDAVRHAVDACRELGADVAAIESGDQIIVAAVNCYDSTYAAAACEPGVSLPAVARSLQVLLFDMSVPCVRPGLLPAATVRRTMRLWERRIALIFGGRYAAGLMAAATSGKTPENMTAGDLDEIRRNLSAALGDCIDLHMTDQ